MPYEGTGSKPAVPTPRVRRVDAVRRPVPQSMIFPRRH